MEYMALVSAVGRAEEERTLEGQQEKVGVGGSRHIRAHPDGELCVGAGGQQERVGVGVRVGVGSSPSTAQGLSDVFLALDLTWP